MKAKAKSQKKVISNRRARHDYELGDSIVVGLELTGREVKCLRLGHGQLQGAYVTVKNSTNGGELWLVNAKISPAKGIPLDEQEQTRSHRLLAKRREIDHLVSEKQQGKAIIPLELLTSGRFIKLRISSGRGKKKYDKRETMKRRETQRTISRSLKRG